MRYLNRYLTKKVKQVATKHMKRCSTSVATWEVQVENHGEMHYTLSRRAKIGILTIASADKEAPKLSHNSVQAPSKPLSKAKHALHAFLRNSTPACLPWRNGNLCPHTARTCMFTAVLVTTARS